MAADEPEVGSCVASVSMGAAVDEEESRMIGWCMRICLSVLFTVLQRDRLPLTITKIFDSYAYKPNNYVKEEIYIYIYSSVIFGELDSISGFQS